MLPLKGILTIVSNYKYVLGAIAIASLTLSVSSFYYNYKIDKLEQLHYNYKKETNEQYLNQKLKILEQNDKLKNENEKLSLKLEGIENEKYKIYIELQESNSRLKSSIRNDERRLFVNASCPASTSASNGKNTSSKTSSLDHGRTTKAIIDRRDAEAIIAITEKADKYKAQLEALQEWVKNLTEPIDKQ